MKLCVIHLWTLSINVCIQSLVYVFDLNLMAFSTFYSETGGIMIVPYPAPENQIWKPSCPLRPFFGVDPVLLNEQVSEVLIFLVPYRA